MEAIDKWWKRFLISLFAGGLLSELSSIITKGEFTINAIVVTIILYLGLSVLYGFIQK